ncbi:MAG: STAS domain-containing protein [Planctomycetaceae bacterium]
MSVSQPSEILQDGPVTILRPGPNFASLFENDLDDAGIRTDFAAELPSPRLVLDLRHVRFIGSAFLGRCIAISKLLRQRQGGKLALCELNPFARAAVSVASLDEVLPVYDSCEEAVVALS